MEKNAKPLEAVAGLKNTDSEYNDQEDAECFINLIDTHKADNICTIIGQSGDNVLSVSKP